MVLLQPWQQQQQQPRQQQHSVSGHVTQCWLVKNSTGDESSACHAASKTGCGAGMQPIGSTAATCHTSALSTHANCWPVLLAACLRIPLRPCMKGPGVSAFFSFLAKCCCSYSPIVILPRIPAARCCARSPCCLCLLR
jgi:hypothetical protein